MAILGLLGGDARQRYLLEGLREDGFAVSSAALGLPEDLPARELLSLCDPVILPLPATRDRKTLHAPLAPAPLLLEELGPLCRGRTAFGGQLAALEGSPAWAGVGLRDYYRDEALLTGNAFLTAEAALSLAIAHTPGSLAGARALVLGFGRIGKALCPLLRGVGARVSCAVRRPEAAAALRGLGCAPVGMDVAAPFDLILNTVPAPTAGEGLLSRQTPHTLLMELASAPGGFDRACAARLGLSVLDAPGLPGRFSPRAAGDLLRDTLERMMR